MTIYQVTQCVHFLEGEAYHSYGIRCASAEVSDLSCDRTKVEKLAGLCNRLALDPVHLVDVAEDFLAEESAWK